MTTHKTDPFGNIKGEEIKKEKEDADLDPFVIDLNDAKGALEKSIDAWDGKIDVKNKTSLLDRVRAREMLKIWKPPFLNM